MIWCLLRTILIYCLLLLNVFPVVYDSKPRFELKVFNQVIQPGSIAYLSLDSQVPLSRIECSFLDRNALFFKSPDKFSWKALIGVDLETSPGDHLLTGTIWTVDGHSIAVRKAIRIRSKKFTIQRIRVNQKYVTLSSKNSERAIKEAKKLEAIWKKVTPERIWKDSFVRPLSSRLTSGFGRRRIVNGETRSPHSGVDLKAKRGTPIKATNSGKVVLAENLFFAGKTIVLDHGLGLYTVYAHCSKMMVKVGQTVVLGEIIGKVGSTGRVTGPHLHWACRLGGSRVNPLNLTGVDFSNW